MRQSAAGRALQKTLSCNGSRVSKRPNVRLGSKADLKAYPSRCPLLGVKQTPLKALANVRC